MYLSLHWTICLKPIVFYTSNDCTVMVIIEITQLKCYKNNAINVKY